MVAGMHKEDLQATSNPASLRVAGTNPSVLVDKTQSARDGLEIIQTKTGTEKEASNVEKEVTFNKYKFNTSPDLSSSDDVVKEIKMEDLCKLVKDVKVDFMDLDSPEDDEPIILKKEKAYAETEETLLKSQPSYPNVEQLTELLVAELNKLKLEAPARLLVLPGQFSSITAQLTKLKTLDAFPSLLNKVTEALNRTAKYVAKENLNIEPIPTTSPSTTIVIPPITTTTFVHFQSPFLSSPPNTTSQSEGELIKNKGKKAMSHKEVEEEESKSDHVHLTKEQIKEQKRIEESIKADMAKKELEMGKEELVDLLGIDVVTNVCKVKMKYDKYCDKMLNRRSLGKIINCDVLSKGKGPITLKVYRDDGSDETIPNFKASDLNVSEWREVMKVCPKRPGAGWTTIYSKIQTRMENMHKTKHELEIDFTKPLGEQDSIIRLNDLTRKKRKHADDIHDYFRSNKTYKSLVRYEDHPAKIVLHEPCLGMILHLTKGRILLPLKTLEIS
ncbi:hypothetical protein Tco_1115909 [Tanacetum coccineum]